MPREDAAKPEFWEKRFRESFTPWDAGRVPAALEQFLKTEPRDQRVLIPGCGSGYEVRAFAEAGLETLAIDFAPAAAALCATRARAARAAGQDRRIFLLRGRRARPALRTEERRTGSPVREAFRQDYRYPGDGLDPDLRREGALADLVTNKGPELDAPGLVLCE